MGCGKRKYYKRAIYIPKDHVIDVSKLKKETESKPKGEPSDWFKKFKKDIGKEEDKR